MPFKGTITPGSSCRLTIDIAPSMPGAVAFTLLWVPRTGSPNPPTPIVDTVAPGARWQKTLTTPASQMLLLDVDLPVDNISNITITMEEGATLVANGNEVADTVWTFLVLP